LKSDFEGAETPCNVTSIWGTGRVDPPRIDAQFFVVTFKETAMRLVISAAALALLCAVPPLAQAQNGQQQRMPLQQRFYSANISRDGCLTQQQAAAGGIKWIAKNFPMIDTQGRGCVTWPQVKAANQQRKAYRQQMMMQQGGGGMPPNGQGGPPPQYQGGPPPDMQQGGPPPQYQGGPPPNMQGGPPPGGPGGPGGPDDEE
jgi:hypothetical protein